MDTENNNNSIPKENHVPEQKQGSSLWETVKFIILALIIVTPIRMFVAQPFIVSGSSMDPTFETGQYLIVDELSYHLGDPKRGDVIILRYPKDTTKFFIKRVVGLPNETIELQNGTVTIKNMEHPEGFAMSEPYVKYPKSDTMTKMLGEGEYFVMGDNRAASSDSRYWGTVPRDLVVGRALIRLLPIASAAVLPGDYNK
ncbi:MAG: signal peptidase I [Candidatus Yonathbacteria bacterium]|nr:signal peptidase I [Candidatus Yonathbacteria bacterium]